MIKGLSGATIWSEDLNRLLPFYRDVLGLPVTDRVAAIRGVRHRRGAGAGAGHA